MHEHAFLDLFRHHRWANLALIDQCLALPEAQLTATMPGTVGSIHEALAHIITSEEGYLRWVGGRVPQDPSGAPGTVTSPAELRVRAAAIGTAIIDWLSALDPDATVDAEWDGQRYQVPAHIPMMQAIVHGGEHRQQIAMILTAQGIEPCRIDVAEWMRLGMPSLR